ncbi:MAG: lipopolysaccharide assembly protein LapB [Pseudomonadales bacterium]|nr:lipopolysaccharide assembly protein LapB [Pseudomonadales bacterium]
MEGWLLYILVLVAIATGWFLGRRERSSDRVVHGPDYYERINYLLNEQPDRAVASFIQDLEVNADTLDTHLALGSLLRRRGELDKAVVVHENILAGKSFGRDVMLNVQMELARDYLLAGLLDRAEALLSELVNEGGSIRLAALKMMAEIYEREKEWEKAIEVSRRLAVGTAAEETESVISHYFCEIAERKVNLGDIDGARASISQAIGHDAHNVRASLLLGKIEASEGRHKEAVRALQRIVDQDPGLVAESLDQLLLSYDQGELPADELLRYLQAALEKSPSIAIVLVIARLVRDEQGDEAVARFIADHLKKNPTIRGLTQLIDLHMDNTSGVAKQNLLILRSFAEALVADKPAYRCRECGFDGKRLHWHCPSCKTWGSIRPIFGLEGQ